VLYGLRREVQDARRYGQYTLVERLGEGGMGVVFRATHALLRRPTAVKLMHAGGSLDREARFAREVQLMAELTHPNTVMVYDYGRTAGGVFYYAMEYLDGVDLEGLIEVGGPQSAGRVIHLLRQICGSLDEAHGRGLIHRDIKPANVFLCRGRSKPDFVKVLDFGLVKDVSSVSQSISTTSAVVGTPLYMPPEVMTHPGAIDARSDVYALGAVAYLLLTGEPVFSGTTAIEVCAKHIHHEPERPSLRVAAGVPEDLETIVLGCLAKRPEQRPSSAALLRAALERCASAGSWSADDAQGWWSEHDAAVEQHRARRVLQPSSELSRTVLVELDTPRANAFE
jgi:eukaryotic-like serine/threonine-protein kinase